MKLSLIIFVIFLSSAVRINAQYWVQKGADILGSSPNAAAGAAVALSDDGNTIAIGANYEWSLGGPPGYVQVYDWNGTSWVQRGSNIISGNFGIDDWFGETISMSSDGNIVAIGAPNINLLQVFTWNGSTWIQLGSSITVAPWSVDINDLGTMLVVRDDQPAISGEDVIKVFMYDSFASDWVQTTPDILSEEISENAGMSISLSGNGAVLAYGSPFNSGNGSGGGSVTTYSTSGFQVGSEINGATTSSLGTSSSGTAVSLNNNGNIMAIGDGYNGFLAGEVKIYEFIDSWTQKGSSIAVAGSGGNGNSVELNLSGDRLVVGDLNFNGFGSMRTYEWNGTNWIQYGQAIISDNIGDRIGNCVSMSSDGFTIAGGAHGNDANGSNAGLVRVFEYCNETSSSIFPVACVSYTVPSGNETYTASGIYSDTISNSQGCDSIITINLTIANNIGTDVQAACDSYTWIDGNTYTSNNNTATYILNNAAGCDSLVTLDLTITNSTNGTDVQAACDSYTWIDGNTYTSNNNTATYILNNAAGCDSLVTLDLTITNSTVGTDIQTACDSFVWIDGNTYTASNNTASYNIVGGSANGCDSLVTLDLTINSVSDITTSTSGVTLTANNSGASYQWLDCNNNNAVITGEIGQSFNALSNGSYAVELTENGCIDTSACAVITTVGIIENSFGDILAAYPNPTTGDFFINLGSSYENTQVIIRDVFGKLIESKNIMHTQVINLSIKEPAGLYLVSVLSGDKKVIIRLIKE